MTAIQNPPVTTGAREFVITRAFDAPPERVFEAWTDPKLLAQWWGPHTFTNPVCDLDVHPGSVYRIVMRSPEGVDYPLKGVYRNVVKPVRLEMTMDCSEHPAEWHDQVKPNRAKGDNNPAREVLATVTFEVFDRKTKLTVRTRFESAEIRDSMVKMGMNEGWSESLERLGSVLKGSEPGQGAASSTSTAEQPFIIARLLDAPRDLVWKAWTEREHMQWWGPKGVSIHHAKLEFRPGGTFHYCMRTADGQDMWGKWVLREITPPQRLVFINSFSDEAGGITRHPMAANWPLEILSTVTFEEQHGKTLLTVRWLPWNASELERKTFDESHESMRGGWTGTLDRLAEYLAEKA